MNPEDILRLFLAQDPPKPQPKKIGPEPLRPPPIPELIESQEERMIADEERRRAALGGVKPSAGDILRGAYEAAKGAIPTPRWPELSEVNAVVNPVGAGLWGLGKNVWDANTGAIKSITSGSESVPGAYLSANIDLLKRNADSILGSAPVAPAAGAVGKVVPALASALRGEKVNPPQRQAPKPAPQAAPAAAGPELLPGETAGFDPEMPYAPPSTGAQPFQPQGPDPEAAAFLEALMGGQEQPAPQAAPVDHYADPEAYLQGLLKAEREKAAAGMPTNEAIALLLSGIASGFGKGPDPYQRYQQIQGIKAQREAPERELQKSIYGQKVRKAGEATRADMLRGQAESRMASDEAKRSFQSAENDKRLAAQREIALASQGLTREKMELGLRSKATRQEYMELQGVIDEITRINENSMPDPDKAAKLADAKSRATYLKAKIDAIERSLGTSRRPDEATESK